MITEINELYGRQTNALDIAPALRSHADVQSRPSMQINTQSVICNRCGMQTNKSAAALPHQQYYCPQCINLGRIVSNVDLAFVAEPNQFQVLDRPLTWTGQLTKDQADCSATIIEHFQQRKAHLLWAVTGAGKTEMLFPGIEWALANGLRIAIASPRVDVCIELFPRLQAAFANTPMILLHGRQTEKYQYSQLTVCTTHQLLRFYHAFDILIIDEVDSFPYANNPGLHFAVSQAVKTTGTQLYLTATPNDELLRLVKRNQLSISYLPLRFHRHLLPQIKLHLIPNWRQRLLKKRLPNRLIRVIDQKVTDGQRFLLFVPHVKDLKPIEEALRAKLSSGAKMMTVHSEDAKRLEKVTAMREQRLDFLITTTILERGVTFPGIDVIVLGADEPIFSPSALVQIAGRVGRKNDRPDGNVDFWVHSNARNVSKAYQQIAHMNKLGALKLRDA
ncbi:DEAD/DEAH box helicase [Nicoliella lavandulae]|uniref:Helicase-related protein n=1 Tax=Nicoliella lavandulae TaxID=3082954 RepID=A0ABU8SK17_9LACO